MSSGILGSKSGKEDYDAVLFVTDTVAEWWNTRCAKRHGFSVSVSERKVRQCCDIGATLFESGIFPDSPGPFKRLAALVVLGRLYPFYIFKPGYPGMTEETEGYTIKTPEEQTAYITRMMVLTIPFVLSKLVATIDGKDIELDEWRGFPSSHYRLEFMGWLRWLDGCEEFKSLFSEYPEKWGKFTNNRLARMVMSTSLMLETCYYLSPTIEAPSSKLLKMAYSGPNDIDEDIKMDLYYDTDAEVRSTPDISKGT